MLNIDIKTGEFSAITLSGVFDLFERDRVESLLPQVTPEALKGLIVDLSKVTYIDSTAIGLLITYCNKMRDCGLRMTLVADGNNYLIRKLNYLGIFNEEGIPVFKTPEEALESYPQ